MRAQLHAPTFGLLYCGMWMAWCTEISSVCTHTRQRWRAHAHARGRLRPSPVRCPALRHVALHARCACMHALPGSQVRRFTLAFAPSAQGLRDLAPLAQGAEAKPVKFPVRATGGTKATFFVYGDSGPNLWVVYPPAPLRQSDQQGPGPAAHQGGGIGEASGAGGSGSVSPAASPPPQQQQGGGGSGARPKRARTSLAGGAGDEGGGASRGASLSAGALEGESLHPQLQAHVAVTSRHGAQAIAAAAAGGVAAALALADAGTAGMRGPSASGGWGCGASGDAAGQTAVGGAGRVEGVDAETAPSEPEEPDEEDVWWLEAQHAGTPAGRLWRALAVRHSA